MSHDFELDRIYKTHGQYKGVASTVTPIHILIHDEKKLKGKSEIWCARYNIEGMSHYT